MAPSSPACITRTARRWHLVVDEADELAPQRSLPDQTTVLHEMERIVRRGLARGFWVLMITQRPAVLHKDVLSQAGCLLAMQLTAAQDRAAIGAWIEGQADRAEAKALLASLPQLRTGEGWLWWPHAGPPVQQRFPRIRTLDTGSTPAHGEETAEAPLSDAGLDLEALRTARAALTADNPRRDDGDRRARGLPRRHPRGSWRAPRRRDRHFAHPPVACWRCWPDDTPPRSTARPWPKSSASPPSTAESLGARSLPCPFSS
jgi:hypothetical protein